MLESIGPVGIAGIGVLLFAFALYQSAIKPAEGELNALRTAVERGASPDARRASGATRAAELQRFYALFPTLDALPGELARLQALGTAAGVEMLRADYRLDGLGAPLAAYRVTLPLRATYPRIRQFIGSILQAMPIVAIDALRFERRNAGEPEVDAQLRLTVYFRSANEEGPR